MGWRNWLEEEVEVVLTVLNQAAEAAYSVQASHWPGGKGRPRERDTAQLVIALIRANCKRSRVHFGIDRVAGFLAEPNRHNQA